MIEKTNKFPLVRSPLVAKALGITPGTLRRWRCEGKGPSYIKIGGTVFYAQDTLKEWLIERTFKNTSHHDVVVSQEVDHV